MKKSEKGSATLLVVITVILIIVLLGVIYGTVVAKRKSQLIETKELFDIYDGNMTDIYDEQIAKMAYATLTINANKGTYSGQTEIEGSNNSTITLSTPTREGYTFAGWTADKGTINGDQYTFAGENAVVTANWDVVNYVQTFDYSGQAEPWTAPYSGNYRIECWGAGSDIQTGYGRGGYVAGTLDLEKNNQLYVYVGGKNRVFNGGGEGDDNNRDSDKNIVGNGGTDVRLIGGQWNNFDSLKSRIIVAGAGGNSDGVAIGGRSGVATVVGDVCSGGGLQGYDGNYAEEENYSNVPTNGNNGTQTSGGNGGTFLRSSGTYVSDAQAGGFGYGGKAGTRTYSNTSYSTITFGGSGGYYGSGGSAGGVTGWWGPRSTAGGSSFISGHNGCDAIASNSTSTNIIHTGQPNHYSGKVFTNTVMIDGYGYKWTTEKASTPIGMPTHDGSGTMTGNAGDGYVKITYLGNDDLVAYYDGINNANSTSHSSNTNVWKDLSGNNRDGIISNATWEDNCLNFNGTSSWVNIGEFNPEQNVTLDLTVSATDWGSTEKDIIANYHNGGYGLDIGTEGILRFEAFILNTGYRTANDIKTFEKNKKVKITATYNGSIMKLYINGVLVRDTEISGKIKAPTNNTVMALGANPNGTSSESSYFNGKIYNARIYSKALTADEVSTNYQIDKARFGID